MDHIELADLVTIFERAAAQSTALANETASALAALKALAARPNRCPAGDEWLAVHADDWDRVASTYIDLDDPVWATPKAAAPLLKLAPTGGAIYDRISRRPIAVKFRGRWYVNLVRAVTLTGFLPGETK